MEKLIVFDIDGTLVQRHAKGNDAAYMSAVQEVLGIIPPDGWDDFVTSTDSGILDEMAVAQLGRNCTPREVARVKECMTVWLDRLYGDRPFEAIPGALEAWRELRDNSTYSVAVATGNWGFSGRFKLASAQFELGDEPFASADEGIQRRDVLASAHRRALESAPHEPFDRIIYVGDGTWDFRAARALGWDFIGVAGACVDDKNGVLRKEGATNLIRDFHDLFTALEKLDA